MELIKSSEKVLMNFHSGCGHVFISDGSGQALVHTDIGFIKNDKGYFIWIGTRKAIKLTDEQVNVIGNFFLEEGREEE